MEDLDTISKHSWMNPITVTAESPKKYDFSEYNRVTMNNQIPNVFGGLAGNTPEIKPLSAAKKFGLQAKAVGSNILSGAKSVNSFLSSTGLGAAGGDLLSGLGSLVGNEYGDDFSESQKASQSVIRQGLAMIPGYGQLIAAATGAVDAIGNMTGLNLSNINQDSADRLGVGTGAKFNNIINHLPGVSSTFGVIGSIFGGGRTNDFNASDEAMAMSDGYSGSVRDLSAAEDIANKRFFSGSSKDKANSAIARAVNTDRILTNVNTVNTQRKQSDYFQDIQNQNINRYAGQNYLGMTVGRNGMKLMSAEEARRIVSMKKTVETEDVEKFANGGTIASVEQSIMPTGSLHKERHHIEDTNPELGEEITKKGIPVISVDENGEVNQIAEVERSEWTLSKSLTDKIEALYKEWQKTHDDQLAIECGMAVVIELKNNTVDPGNQINLEGNGEE